MINWKNQGISKDIPKPSPKSKDIWRSFKNYEKDASQVNLKNNAIFSFDIETNGLDARKFLFGVVTWISKGQGYYKVFKTHNDMFEFFRVLSLKAQKMKIKNWVYAHNLQYDFYGVFQDNYFPEGMNYICFKPFIAEYNQYMIFDDNLAIYPMALKKIGDIVGLPKFETPYEMIEGDVKEITAKDIEYCVRDCQIILKGLIFYKDTLEELFGIRSKKMMTTPQITIKQFQSFQRWKEEFNEPLFNKFNRIEYDTTQNDFLRLSYRGSRVQAFKKGNFENATQIDINSLYPYIMKDLKFPDFKHSVVKQEPSVDWVKKHIDYDGVIKCTMNIPKQEFGYLPVLYKKYQLFANNECQVKGIWTLFEIKEALKLGYELINVDKVVLYEKGYNKYFENYITKLYDVKKNDPKLKPIAKLLMNSLYGKFGQINDTFDLKHIKVEDIYQYPEYTEKGRYGDNAIIEKKLEAYVPKWSMPYISSIITAKARDYLYKALKKVDPEDLLYSDTDSIILLNIDKYKDVFVYDEEIGNWKIEEENENCSIKGEKLKTIGKKVNISGVPSMYRTQENFDKGEFNIRIMNTLKGNMSNHHRVGTFFDKKIDINNAKKEDIYREFEDYCNKNLIYFEKYI